MTHLVFYMTQILNQYIISGVESSANITPQKGTRLIVTQEADAPIEQKKPRPHYNIIGSGMKTRYFQSYPYEETLLDLSKPEAWFFRIIFKAWGQDGYSDISHIKFTPTEKAVASAAFKKLKERDLVRRVKKQVYLINPCAKIRLDLFDDLFAVWYGLNKPKIKKEFQQYEYLSWFPKHFWLLAYKSWDAKTNLLKA